MSAPNSSVTAGYFTTYDASADNSGSHNFTFLTIKGAGHMAPEFKPVSSLAFLSRFMRGEPLEGPHH